MKALGPFNVSEPLDEAVVAIPDGEQPGGEGAKILFHPETVIPPFELIRQEDSDSRASSISASPCS